MGVIRRSSVFPSVVGIVLACLAAPVGATPRIVSLSPHITELLYAAGAGDTVVGVDDSSDYPPPVLQLPKVGEPASVDLERLLQLKPTLVIVWDSGTPPRLRSELQRLKLRVVVEEQRRLDDIGQALLDIGTLAGTPDAARVAAANYRAELAALRSRYAGRPSVSVFYQVWDRPLYTLSGAHVISEVLSLCGGRNVFAALKTLAPAVDREAVLAQDPQVLLIGAAAADGARQAADWSRFPTLRAVRDHHVYTIDPSLTSRMAPRILQGISQVCDVLDEARQSSARRH